MQSWVQINTKSQAAEITDPLKVFDYFSVFVEPISYQRIFDLASVLYITPLLLGKILEIQLALILARRAKDCFRSPLLVAFKIPDIYFCLVYPIDVPFLSSVRVYFV